LIFLDRGEKCQQFLFHRYIHDDFSKKCSLKRLLLFKYEW